MRISLLALLLLIALHATRAAAEDVINTLDVNGEQRAYLLHVPAALQGDAPAALVIVLHGGGGSAQSVMEQTGFAAEADRRGFIVAFPDGSDRARPLLNALGRPGFLTWNAGACCGYAVQRGKDDVGFIRAMVADIARHHAIDPKRIFASGHSNGGMMAYRLACEASDLVAAVGVVSGVIVVAPCEPRFPVALIDIHGSADENVPLDGGVGAKSFSKFPYPPVQRSIDRWVAFDDCGKDPVVSTPAADVTLRAYPHCTGNTAVDYYVIDGGGHAWPGGKQMLKILDKPSTALDATPLIWRFFVAHPKP